MRFRMGNGKMLVVRNPFQMYRIPRTLTWGLTNLCADNKFVIFLDYDDVEYKVCREDVKMLQDDFNIGTVITRVSSIKNYRDDEIGNYHVISFQKYYFDEIKKLIAKTRCDDHFKRGYIYQQRCWVLRVGEGLQFDPRHGWIIVKPFTVLREVIKQKHDGRQKESNQALLNFFEDLDNIKLKNYFKRVDNLLEPEIIRFGGG